MDHDQSLTLESATPSTPPPAVFSDDANRPSSPPSSPPGFPWDYDNAPKPKPKPPQRTAFTLLGKRKALSPVSDNARPTKKHAAPAKKPEKGALTQMQISLGQQVQKRCKTCGMEYVASSTEDRKLHDKYHKQNTEGYDVGKDFVRTARAGTVFDGVKKGDAICMIDRRDKTGRRTKAQAVLDIVQRELGAVEIRGDDVWGAEMQQHGRQWKHRHYLYLRGTKCVGYLLVERIQEAREVIAPESSERPIQIKDTDSSKPARQTSNAVSALRQRLKTATEALHQAETSPIELSPAATKASLGVSRIWTSSTHRRQNIATALLDAAVSAEEDGGDGDGGGTGRRTPKGMVAFSQPTASGARLARKWFGRIWGWKVYVD